MKEMLIDKARWLIAAVHSLQECPVIAINGFKDYYLL